MERYSEILGMLEEQSGERNVLINARLRKMAGDIFKKYSVPEFDYLAEMKTIAAMLRKPENYSKVKKLLSFAVKFSGDRNTDTCVMIGAFALALGNPIDVKDDGENAVIYQFVPDNFASKSGISDCGMEELGEIGDWFPIEIKGDMGSLGEKRGVVRNIELKRTPFSDSEIISGGEVGIKRTAKAMKETTQDYLENPKFSEDLDKIEKWCNSILMKKGVHGDRQKYLGTISRELNKPEILRYEKDPLFINNGRLDTHEWLQRPNKSLSDGVADCDCMSILMGCIGGLMGLGVTYRIAKCNPAKKTAYSHVYPILSYPEGVDSLTGENNVICDLVYTKRVGFDGGYGKEPRNFGTMDYKVL